MGIIKAATSAVSGTAKDQWKEFFYCDSLTDDVMMVRGRKVSSGNNQGDDNVITDGSTFAVADGQAVVITCQGKVVDTCAEPGEHIYQSEYSASLFQKGGVSKFFKEAARRFTYAGDIPAVVERIYYLNTKVNNRGSFGPLNISYHFLDKNTGLDVDCDIETDGIYSFKVADPAKFYKLVAGNVSGSYKTEAVIKTMNAEFSSVMQTALSKLSSEGKRSYEMTELIPELTKELTRVVSDTWKELRGIELVNLGFTRLTTKSNDKALVNAVQYAKSLTDPTLAAATLVASTAEAMVNASENTASNMAMAGVMGTEATGEAVALFDTAKKASDSVLWTCECGNKETANFCRNCGKKRPE